MKGNFSREKTSTIYVLSSLVIHWCNILCIKFQRRWKVIQLFVFLVLVVLLTLSLSEKSFKTEKQSTLKLLTSVDASSRFPPNQVLEDFVLLPAVNEATNFPIVVPEFFPHQLSSEEPYYSRMLHIHKECSVKTIEVKLRKSSFKFDDKSQLVLCEVPKAASTTWQLLLLRLSGFEGEYTDELLKTWDYSSIPNKNFEVFENDYEILCRMKSYTTFMLVRHPFERLVSAYYDKLSNRSSYDSYRKNHGTLIAKVQAADYMHGIKYSSRLEDLPLNKKKRFVRRLKEFQILNEREKNEVMSYLEVINSGLISFQQFVKYIIYLNTNKQEFDIHWRPQASLCQPCLFNYSYVIKFENVVVESNRLLDYIQKNKTAGKIEFPGKTKPATRSTVTEETFKLISEEDVDKLRRIYQDDFRIFDYNPYSYQGS